MKTAAAVVFHSALLAFSAWGGMQGRMVLNGDGWLRFSERGELATCPPESDARWKRTSVPEVVERWGAADEAWYRRRIDVPASWKNRRIVLSFGAIQIAAKIHVDGKYAGDVVYPGGEVDLTHILSPGTHEIEIRCIARVSSGNDVHYMDFDRKITTPSVIAFRWITGDVILRAMPKGARIEDVQVVTSVRDRTITFDCETANLDPNRSYRLSARVRHVDGLDTKRFSFAPARTHKRTADILATIRRWEDVRARKWLTPEQKELLKDPAREFHLVDDAKGGYELLEWKQLDVAGGKWTNVRAFIYERGGRRVVEYWHVSDRARLVLASPLDGIAELEASDVKRLETDLPESAVRAAFAGATIK